MPKQGEQNWHVFLHVCRALTSKVRRVKPGAFAPCTQSLDMRFPEPFGITQTIEHRINRPGLGRPSRSRPGWPRLDRRDGLIRRHSFGEPTADASCRSSDRRLGQMCIAHGRGHLGVAEETGHGAQLFARRHRDRGIAVSEVMQTQPRKPGQAPHPVPHTIESVWHAAPVSQGEHTLRGVERTSPVRSRRTDAASQIVLRPVLLSGRTARSPWIIDHSKAKASPLRTPVSMRSRGPSGQLGDQRENDQTDERNGRPAPS